MPQILLVNPSARPRHTKSEMDAAAEKLRQKFAKISARKGATRAIKRSPRSKPMAKAKRSPKQLAATRKLIAFNRAKARGSRPATRRPNPHPAAMRAPVKRKPHKAAARKSPRKHARSSIHAASTAGRVLRYRRPNPIGSFMKDTLMPSVVGGAGALVLDIAVGLLPLPPAFKAGPMAPLVKVAGAVGIGMLAGQFLGRRVGEQVAAGGLTVTMYNVARQLLVKVGGGSIPGLSEYVSMYPDALMGDYTDYGRLGYESSGAQVGDYNEAELGGFETGVYR